MLKKIFKNEKGLTLVELLAVIVILGIIAGIAVPSVMSIIQKSKVNAVRADALQVISAAKTYAAANTDATTITEFDLADYIIKSKLNTSSSATDADYTVTVSDNGQTFKLTANTVTVGTGVTVKFTGASPEGIDKSKDYKGTITIAE